MCRDLQPRLAALLTALFASTLACPAVDDAKTMVDVRLKWVLREAAVTDTPSSLRNDVGLEIEVDELYVSNFTAQLLPCEDGLDTSTPAGRPTSTRPPSTRVAALSLVGVARAGHGDILGEAALREPVPEWLGDEPAARSIEAPRVAYCRVHYLVARQPTPAGLDLEARQTSVFVAGRGRWEGRSREFVVHTKLAHGKVLDLPEPALADRVVVELRRDLAQLFNGFTLESLGERDAERRLLRNLIDAVSVVVSDGTRPT